MATRTSTRRTARTPAPRPSCTTPGCCLAYGPEHQFCEIMGPRRLPTRDQARLYVGAGFSGTDEQREALIDWIATWGDCVWHAAHVVFGTPTCACTPCVNGATAASLNQRYEATVATGAMGMVWRQLAREFRAAAERNSGERARSLRDRGEDCEARALRADRLERLAQREAKANELVVVAAAEPAPPGELIPPPVTA